MKILIVDDDSLAAEMTSAVLEEAGYEVVICENGIDALEKLGGNSGFSLVVSDLNMPFISGIELFKTLREQDNRLPFILLTGDDPAQILKTAPDLDGCVMKDFSLEQVLPDLVAQLVPQ